MRTHWLLILIILVTNPVIAKPRASQKFIAYVGTYTGARSKGVYAFRFDAVTGKLTPIGLAAETQNPSFLAVHPNRKFLYAVNEVDQFDGRKNNGALSAFAIDPKTGKLEFLNQESTGGAAPCHLIVDTAGRSVLVANYTGGSVAAFSVQADGRVSKATTLIQHTGSSVNKQRQEGPHAHGVYLDASNRFAAVADLGLDRVLVYKFDASTGSLAANEPPFARVRPGAGPRHFAFHPAGAFAYVNNEMASTITAFKWNGREGSLKEIETLSTLPQDFTASNSTAELEVHPSGKFVYVSNRGHNSIAVFAVDRRTGKLRLVQHQPTLGKTPRGFEIDPTGRFLLAANQESDSVVVFRINAKTGRLSATNQTVEVGTPVCIKFVRES